MANVYLATTYDKGLKVNKMRLFLDIKSAVDYLVSLHNTTYTLAKFYAYHDRIYEFVDVNTPPRLIREKELQQLGLI